MINWRNGMEISIYFSSFLVWWFPRNWGPSWGPWVTTPPRRSWRSWLTSVTIVDIRSKHSIFRMLIETDRALWTSGSLWSWWSRERQRRKLLTIWSKSSESSIRTEMDTCPRLRLSSSSTASGSISLTRRYWRWCRRRTLTATNTSASTSSGTSLMRAREGTNTGQHVSYIVLLIQTLSSSE